MSEGILFTSRLEAVENELLRVSDVVSNIQQKVADVQSCVDKCPACNGARQAAPTGRERRKETRQAVNVQVRLNQSQQSATFDGCIHDFTPGGVGIKVELLVPVGTIITLAPPPSPNPQPVVEAVVCNHRQDGTAESGSHRWELGCQLLRRLTGKELMGFGLN